MKIINGVRITEDRAYYKYSTWRYRWEGETLILDHEGRHRNPKRQADAEAATPIVEAAIRKVKEQQLPSATKSSLSMLSNCLPRYNRRASIPSSPIPCTAPVRLS
jgi:hypothetical protein